LSISPVNEKHFILAEPVAEGEGRRAEMAAHFRKQQPPEEHRMFFQETAGNQTRLQLPKESILIAGETHMLAALNVQRIKLEELRARRKPLFEWYEKNPSDIRLVLEIKDIDDQIAECNAQIERERIDRN
jgi:hypothetical protein